MNLRDDIPTSPTWPCPIGAVTISRRAVAMK